MGFWYAKLDRQPCCFNDLDLALLSIIKLWKRGRVAEGTGLLNRSIGAGQSSWGHLDVPQHQ